MTRFPSKCSPLYRVVTRALWSGEITIPLDERKSISIETGSLARFASGSAVCKSGASAVLCATVHAREGFSTDHDLPLTVRYQEKAASAGRIPTNFLRRDSHNLSDVEIFTSRAIDRSVRPFFDSDYKLKTELSANVLSLESATPADVLAVNAASASLGLSDIPWHGPIGCVRLAVLDGDGGTIVNPSFSERRSALLDILISATVDGKVAMLELTGRNAPLEVVETALKVGVEKCAKAAAAISDFVRNYEPKSTMELAGMKIDSDVVDRVSSLCLPRLTELMQKGITDKLERGRLVSELRNEAKAFFCTEEGESSPNGIDTEKRGPARLWLKQEESPRLPREPKISPSEFSLIFDQLLRSVAKDYVLTTGKRPDGRLPSELRTIECEIGLYPNLHGSALFTKGQSQVLATLTFDAKDSAFKSDPVALLLGSPREKMFMAHYQFNQYANNELSSGPTFSRREMGHSRLIENALKSLLPDSHPFATRLVCEVLESAGSTSMGSVCAGFLALVDSGMELTLKNDAIAGVACTGLLRGGDKPILLMDSTGFEDFFTDMELKLAGSSAGVTCAQMDCKLHGVPFDDLLMAFRKAHDSNCEVVEILKHQASLAKGRSSSSRLPVEEVLYMPGYKKSVLLRHGAFLLKQIQEETGVRITQDDEESLNVFAYNQHDLDAAKARIEEVVTKLTQPQKELEFRGIYKAKILEVLEKSVVVTIEDAIKEAKIPLRLLDQQRGLASTAALDLKPGQEIQVLYLGVDPSTGMHRLSRRHLQKLSN